MKTIRTYNREEQDNFKTFLLRNDYKLAAHLGLLDYYETLFPTIRSEYETFTEDRNARKEKLNNGGVGNSETKAIELKMTEAVKGHKDFKGLVLDHKSPYREQILTGYKKTLEDMESGYELYLSVDMKSANFTVLKALGILPYKTYEDFVEAHGGDDFMKKNRASRQAFFGRLAPKEIESVERHLMGKLAQRLDELELFSLDELDVFNKDELVYKVSDKENFKEYFDKLNEELDHEVFSVEVFLLTPLTSKSNMGFVKEFLAPYTDKESQLYAVSKRDWLQAYKELKGLPLVEEDFLFMDNGRLQLRYEDMLEHQSGLVEEVKMRYMEVEAYKVYNDEYPELLWTTCLPVAELEQERWGEGTVIEKGMVGYNFHDRDDFKFL